MSQDEDQYDRGKSGRFAPGNAGGPGGSRRHALSLRRAAEHALTEDHVQAMIRKAVRLALEGNVPAMRLAFDRTIGRPGEAAVAPEPLRIDLSKLDTAADCDRALQQLTALVVEGSIPDARAKVLIDALQARLKALEQADIEQRLEEMERVAKRITERRA